MPSVGVDLMQVGDVYGNDPRRILDFARMADGCGVDELHISDHVVISRGEVNRRDTFPWAWDFPWFEPLTTLAAVAAVTTRVRLVTSILIGPLRPAVLLAKQVATLDALSHGRVELGLGAGWQRAEFDAAGVPFENRLELLAEQVQACRELWGGASASFRGRYVDFESLHSFPLPLQGDHLPIALGLPLTSRNVELIARHADGWLAQAAPVDQIRRSISRVRSAVRDSGRQSRRFKVTVKLPAVTRRSGAGSGEVLPAVRAYFDADADAVVARLVPSCAGADDVQAFLDRLVALSSG
jgi:probable F420-dependent oxidoreductase